MDTPSEPALSAIMGERRRLINLAYRLLGSLADAEDVVQETYVRWYAMSPGQQAAIRSPGAWLTTVAGRICLDVLGSARARRERYVGAWLPEPLPDSTELTQPPPDPADRVTLDESLSMAFLVLLESMTPAERVAFVLHDVFRYPFTDVAAIVGRTPAACRQLAVSARRRVREAQPVPSSRPRHTAVIRDFKEAWQSKDINALIHLLDPNATATSDGGGHVAALPHPLQGAEQIAHFFTHLLTAAPTLHITERTVNGQPGLVVELDGRVEAVLAFEVAEEQVRRIWAMRNPEKLRSWTAG
ncbi:RNA polymerase sigma factor SigJ [Streptomyces sp. SID13726]|uniref:RNA polymerase sigma factor SigJ n=1 Tax=Streptomyces sp. SID13726 TaxID=2706058 RepID=UPI0013BB59ED|nr:RNA polymerase sigma factor SigJ [Streptomyces sp. SID13726]NEA99687.1 sigma-70 family RNA polymerase sigma factor [Streptomyces sp. SID13726]